MDELEGSKPHGRSEMSLQNIPKDWLLDTTARLRSCLVDSFNLSTLLPNSPRGVDSYRIRKTCRFRSPILFQQHPRP